MSEADPKWDPFLLIVRGLGWGAVGGGSLAVLLVAPGGALPVLAATASGGDIGELVTYLAIVGLVAALGGAVVGAAFGLAGGLALALSGRRAVQRMHRARLITGAVAVAIPLVKAHFFSRAWGLHLGGYAGAAVLAALGACAAMLLTPLVVHGWPDRREPPERLPVGAEPARAELAVANGGSDLSDTGAPEPRWLIVGRGVSWGVIGGAALGALCWTALRLGSDAFGPLTMLWLALGGAALGAVLGFTAGLAVPLSGSEDRQSSARLG